MTGDSFFDSVRSLGIRRPDNTPLAGVCAGLARRWGVDPVLVRAAVVALGFFGGAGVTLYALGWLFLPADSDRIPAQEPFYGTVSSRFVFAIILVFLPTSGWGFQDVFFVGPFGFIITVVITVLVVLALRDSRVETRWQAEKDAPERDSPPGPDRRHLYSPEAAVQVTPPAAGGRLVLFAIAVLLIIAAGVAYAIDRGSSSLSDSALVLAACAAASILLGLTVTVYGIVGRRGGGLSTLAILAALLCLPIAATTSIPSAEHSVIMGERVWAPTSASDADGGFSVLLGSGEIDVTGLDEAEIDVTGRLGEVTIVIGDEQRVAVVADYVMSDLSGVDERSQRNSGVAGDATILNGDIDSIDDADIIIRLNLVAADFTLERQS